jgi:hypothetical protein
MNRESAGRGRAGRAEGVKLTALDYQVSGSVLEFGGVL